MKKQFNKLLVGGFLITGLFSCAEQAETSSPTQSQNLEFSESHAGLQSIIEKYEDEGYDVIMRCPGDQGQALTHFMFDQGQGSELPHGEDSSPGDRGGQDDDAQDNRGEEQKEKEQPSLDSTLAFHDSGAIPSDPPRPAGDNIDSYGSIHVQKAWKVQGEPRQNNFYVWENANPYQLKAAELSNTGRYAVCKYDGDRKLRFRVFLENGDKCKALNYGELTGFACMKREMDKGHSDDDNGSKPVQDSPSREGQRREHEGSADDN